MIKVRIELFFMRQKIVIDVEDCIKFFFGVYQICEGRTQPFCSINFKLVNSIVDKQIKKN
ncbi:hypothetical protein BpHYR1_040278 [Brachionus plicatilis]|uniref:Uncharacterized protein n=1 Tax=Brachionus plicatilis TaxID=10195 RepID=A0A3M7R7Y9_BRAPC|nr:hypothetical protein BpHYR1_040278 [Brachionus plicatilis]